LKTKEFLAEMSKSPHVSGYEGALHKLLSDEFSKYADVSVDKFGNLVAYKAGDGGPKVMIAAHMDEIGMMVTTICDGGFVKLSPVGGIDRRNILASEVTIHGRDKVYGVIGIKPPHLTSATEMKKAIALDDMVIDTGYSKEKLENMIRPGDIITFNQSITELQNDKISGKALDNTAGIAAMYCAMKKLAHFNHKADICFVASAQEELGFRGAITSAYHIKPDIGIAVDVTFGPGGGVGEQDAFKLGGGPVIAVGPNINRKLFERLKKTAIKNGTKYQIEVVPGITMTDATAIQITEGGAITGLLSIPLNYMHSTVETAALFDIENCGKLIADYIMELQNWKEDELCYSNA